jgi:hypothetical protein
MGRTGQRINSIEVGLSVFGNALPSRVGAGITVALPSGSTFANCPKSAQCNAHTWTLPMALTRQGNSLKAHVSLPVKALGLGINYNCVTAVAELPSVWYSGKGNPVLYAQYNFPSAESYDWASYPTSSIGSSWAVWNESITPGTTVAHSAVGLNDDAQQKNNNELFIAGILFAFATGLVLTAFVEALHVRDWAALRAVHRG